ncbi:MAG: D-lyxose/D-mannose family sugar isomerase [Candidatus Brocadiia bacterium]
MRRSTINRLLEEAVDLLEKWNFALPPFAFWTPEEWQKKGPECDEIRRNALGWDITDFGLGDFENNGVLLFTIRNGNPADPEGSKPYCEKIIISRPDQKCLLHFHWQKVEDIINRAGGDLVLRLYGSDEAEQVDRANTVTVSLDGVRTEVAAGGLVRLCSGESICLEPGMYHEFWAEGEPTLIGEVSAVNDDASDNRFAEPVGRFPEIEEDEPILYYLCNEYPPAR